MAKLTAGIDIDSMATKAVIFDGEVRGEAFLEILQRRQGC